VSVTETQAEAEHRAVLADRERIRLGMFACQDCGKVHEYRQESQFCWSWAADDGHAYVPAHADVQVPWTVRLGSLLREDA
jgi:hypothetical protein